MGLKTRYLQLSLTTMLEYNIDSEEKEQFNGNVFKFNMTKLLDGHYSLLSPCSYVLLLLDFVIFTQSESALVFIVTLDLSDDIFA